MNDADLPYEQGENLKMELRTNRHAFAYVKATDLRAATQRPAFAVQGSPTSEAAARSIEPSRGSLRERVYAFVRDHGPVTDEDIALGLNMNPSTARPRRGELYEAQRIRPYAVDGRTRSGRAARRWVAC